jgi:nucleotide-binding universal stress UspA family protein
MKANKRILVAIDDSKASASALAYVVQMLGGRDDYQLLLVHVPASMPPELLEFGGAEHPVQEEKADAALSTAQHTWVERVGEAVEPLFARAKTRLQEAGIPAEMVSTEVFVPPGEQSLYTSILEVAHARQCGTVVVGRQAFTWLQELFRSHLADKLLQEADDLALWIVQ